MNDNLDLAPLKRREEMVYGKSGNIKPINILVNLLLGLMVLTVFDGLVPQLQLFIVGDVLLPNIVTRPLILLVLTLIFIYQRNKLVKLNKTYVIYLILDIMYLSTISVYQIIYLDQTYSDILYVLNNYYFWSVVTILFLAVFETVKKTISFRTLAIVTLPIVSLGIYQSVSENIVLFQRSDDNSFYVSAIYFFGKVRAFSIFTSGYAFGQYLCLALSLTLSAFFIKSTLFKFLFSIIILLTVYFTYTRTIYLAIFLILFYHLAEKMFGDRARKFYPATSLLFGFFVLQLSNVGISESTILSQSTSLERFNNWANIASSWISNPLNETIPLPLLIGDGRFQNIRFSQFEQITIDNSYISILVNSGILGLLLFIIGYLLIYRAIYRYNEMKTQGSGIVIFASVFPFLAVFNNAHTNFYSIILLGLFIATKSKVRFKEQKLIRNPFKFRGEFQ